MTRPRSVRWGLALAMLATPALAGPPQEPRADAGAKAPARSTGPGGTGGRGVNTSVMVVTAEAVRKELKLTEEQMRKIREVNDDFNRRRRDSARALPRDGDRIDTTALTAMIAEMRAENEAAISRILDRDQRRRLAQIILRMDGVLGVARPEVAAMLNLNPVQVEAIREVIDGYREAQDRLWEAHDDALRSIRDRRAARARGPEPRGARAGRPAQAQAAREPKDGLPRVAPEVEALNSRYERESAALLDSATRQLTRKQRDAYNKLLGPPFDLATLQSGGGAGAALPPEDAPTALEPISPKDRPAVAPEPAREGPAARGKVAGARP